jgi:prepilin-type processing-associated H-X9-DG protein
MTMKLCFSNKRNVALTLVEALVVIVVLAILAVILLPSLAPVHRWPSGNNINCISNLKQIGLAYRLWEGDNNGKYPMAVSVTNGGAMELVATGNVAVCFQVMSNELSTPKILLCPEDTRRVRATNFSTLNSSNISYFVGLDAAETKPQMFLSGDDNLAISGIPVKSGVLELSTNTPVTWTSLRHVAYNSHFWTAARHKFVGNIGMADGSAQQFTTDGLQKALQQTGVTTNRLVSP